VNDLNEKTIVVTGVNSGIGAQQKTSLDVCMLR